MSRSSCQDEYENVLVETKTNSDFKVYFETVQTLTKRWISMYLKTT